MTTPTALLLVGDGTRDEDGAEAFRSFVRELAEQHPELPVAGGFAQLSQPSVEDAAEELVAGGAARFAAVPVTLTPSAHETAHGSEPPSALSKVEELHPGTSCLRARALGPHPTVLSVLERRVEEAWNEDGSPADSGNDDEADAGPANRTPRTPDDRRRTTLLLVGPGSSDPYANAEVHRAARLLWEGRGYAGVETAFVTLAGPDVASGLDRCRKLGAAKVVVVPYLLFAGTLGERVRQQSAGWAAANRDVEVRNAGPVDGAEELAGLVMERYREAVDGARTPTEKTVPDGDADARTP